MRKFGLYLFGFISGIIICNCFFAIKNQQTIYDNPYNLYGLRMLPEEGGCIISKNIRIFQVITDGIALATTPNNVYEDTILLLDDTGKLFYDNEIIKMPTKKCAKQVGVYSYKTMQGIQKTIPAVIIK